MESHEPLPTEKGHTRLVFDPDLELSLPEAQELVSLVERWSTVRGMAVHWQADAASPVVHVEASSQHFDRALDKLLQELGGLGPLGTLTDRRQENPDRTIGRALLVVPDETLRDIGTRFLAVIGMDVDDVASAKEAATLVQAQEYDLLIVGSADLGDATVSDLLQRLEPQLEMTTPVIFWTASPFEFVLPSVKDLRAPLLMLSKPNDFHDFREKVGRALEWRHLVKLRRRVRAHIESQVTERVRAIAADVLGSPMTEGCDSRTSVEGVLAPAACADLG